MLCAVPDLWNQVRMSACLAAGGRVLGACDEGQKSYVRSATRRVITDHREGL
jgi:hypothetical protein